MASSCLLLLVVSAALPARAADPPAPELFTVVFDTDIEVEGGRGSFVIEVMFLISHNHNII